MNILKNFEAVFIGATAIAITSAVMLTPASTPVSAPQIAPSHVVVVSAKRLTLEEKQQSLREERQLAAARQSVARG